MNLRPYGMYSLGALLLLLFLPSILLGITVEDLLDRVQKRYRQTQDLTAEFKQETHVRMIDRIQRAEGKVFFKNPAKMRWEYRGRQKKEIVINGNTMWVYDAYQKQVTITDLSKVGASQTYMTFLTGMGDLRRDFRAEGEGPVLRTEEGPYRIGLTPRDPKNPFSRLTLLIDPDSYQILGTSFLGLQGDLTVLTYRNILTNQGLPDSTFQFRVPEGVEVLHYPPKEGG